MHRNTSSAIGEGATPSDATNQEKETLLVKYAHGVHLYGVLSDGGEVNWVGAGGHGSGGKPRQPDSRGRCSTTKT